MGIAEVPLLQMGRNEVRPLQVGPSEVRASQVSLGKIEARAVPILGDHPATKNRQDWLDISRGLRCR